MEQQDNNMPQQEESVVLGGGVTMSKNLYQRIISGVVLLSVALAVIAAGGWIFKFFIIGLGVLMAYEWKDVVLSSSKIKENGDKSLLWTFLGVAYIAIPCASIIAIRQDAEGLALMLWLCGVVCATDICAYAVGRTVGGPKIAPSISPKKTWSGLIGGMTGALLIGVFAGLAPSQMPYILLIIFSVVLAVVSQAGDFLESYIKRYFGVKDSSNIIPGHGGVMDRLDGMITAAPLVLIIHSLTKIF